MGSTPAWERDESDGPGGPSTFFYDGGGLAVDAWDQDDTIGGNQLGNGAKAGNRIWWTWDGVRKRNIPIYYHDPATVVRPPGHELGSHGGPDGRTAEHGGEKEGKEAKVASETPQLLEYLGCFRDHPGLIREYSGKSTLVGEGTVSYEHVEDYDDFEDYDNFEDYDDGTETLLQREWESETGAVVYVFPGRLTVNVRERRSQALFGSSKSRLCSDNTSLDVRPWNTTWI